MKIWYESDLDVTYEETNLLNVKNNTYLLKVSQ